MLQESVYCKLALNSTRINTIIEQVMNNKPPKGVVQLLSVTEKQYSRMIYVVGEPTTDVINSDERTVIL